MGTSLAVVSTASFLLDVIPVAGIILLIIAFVYGRRKRRNEERELKDVIRRYEE